MQSGKMARKPPTFDVWVGNLPSDANEKNLNKFFVPFGEIAGMIVKETPRVPPPNNKFAFVKYMCEPDADRAVKELDKMKLNGATIVVKRSENRPEKKKNTGDGGGKRKISDSGKEGGNNQPDWICPESGCGNSNFGWRNQCNKCNAQKPNLGTPNNVQDGFESSGVVNNQYTASGVQAKINAEQELQGDTVMITHVETPITVWVQVVNDENTKKIFHITEQLGTLCPAASPVTAQPDSSKVYACLFAEDNMWYRCQVRQTLGTDKYKIQYIDYGNTEEVPLKSLVELTPGLANIKGLASKIVLHNMWAKDLTDKQGIQLLKSLTDNQMARVVRTRPLTDGSGHYGNLFIGGINIGDSMLQAGYCQSKPGMGRSGQSARPPQNDAGMFSELSGPQMMGPSSFSGGSGTRQSQDRDVVSPFSQPPPLFGQPPFSQPPMGQQHAPNMGFPKQIGLAQDSGREKKLQQQLNKKNQEIERIKNEKDAACIQAEYMRTKVKTLQDEFSASAAKLQEDTLSNRISTVVALAKIVRRIRDQFPTGQKSCLLVDMIEAAMDPERVDTSKCGILQDVGSSLAKYKAAQKEISQCQKQAELEDLIVARNECRVELHRSLSSCLEEMAKLPLEKRSKLVQEVQDGLVNVYGDFLKFHVQEVPSLENLKPGFKTWKSKKDVEFQDVRTATDFCEGALQTALNHVKQRISMEVVETAEQSDVDIDSLFKTYAHALQREINATDLVHGKDANFVATVIASVRKELQTEAAALDNIRVLQQEFASRKQLIEPWLKESPTFTELQENRKLVRSLKSKLRHTLADKLDVEESNDGDLDSILKEEQRIRTELQAALAHSDTLLHDIAMLADSNFPELIVQYPDLGVDSYLLYKGLVKANRDIDQYCLKPCFGPGVHLSMFVDQPVMIQEFHIGDSDHCSKEEFMKQLVTYCSDDTSIQAVFFSKNDRLAYVQSKWDGGELLDVALRKRQLDKMELLKVSEDLTTEVAKVHRRGCIHGEINPQSVIIKEDNSVYLMYPDFSRRPNERVSKKFVTEEGLVFQSPELLYSSPEILGPAADIYNLVLLIFWMHNPDKKLALDKPPKIKDQNPVIQQLFDGVLGGKTATRIHAEHVMQQLRDAAGHAKFEASRNAQKQAAMDKQQNQTSSQVASFPEHGSLDSPGKAEWGSDTVQQQVSQRSKEPAIISTDEPMEIGVFRAEDYMDSEPISLPTENLQKILASDTDNSWTTESSMSGTSGSREDSPLDTTVMEAGPQNVVTSDTDTLSEGLSDLSCKLGNCLTVSNGHVDTPSQSYEVSEGVQTEDVAEPEQNSVNSSTQLEENLQQTEQSAAGSPSSGVTEKGAACEFPAKDQLKTLLNDSRTFLTHGGRKSPLASLMNMTKKQSSPD